jgi:hypothetical protein
LIENILIIIYSDLKLKPKPPSNLKLKERNKYVCHSNQAPPADLLIRNINCWIWEI